MAAVRVFLSCAAEEVELKERIAAALRSEGHRVSFGVAEDDAENAVHAKIRRTLRRSHAMVFLISPRAVAKDSHARMELDIVEGEWASPAERLIPVMAEETPSEDLPPFLRELKVIRSNAKAELSHELADVLAKVSHDSEGAKTMATRAGFPAEHVPDFKTPLDFWTRIIAGANRGRMRPKSLVEEAVKQFPHNAELRTHAKRLDVALASEVSVIAAGQSVMPRVSYAVDVLARRRRRSIARGIGVAATGVSLAAAIAWWLVPRGHEETDAKKDPALPADDTRAEHETSKGDDGTVPVDPAPVPTWTWKDGEILLEDGGTMLMVQLDGGSFMMGSPKSEADRIKDEALHMVKVSSFWIAQTEVTQAQWKAVMGRMPNNWNCALGCGGELPVSMVSWEDAVEFTNALSKNLGLAECYSQDGTGWSWAPDCDGIRLPTESEWEYAARANTATPYAFGSSVKELCNHGNVGDKSAQWAHPEWVGMTDVCDDGHANLAPVKTFEPNTWRLHDMHGNVFEWVWDWYATYPGEQEVDPRGPRRGTTRVIRGGSFWSPPKLLRSANRLFNPPADTNASIGFRCARSVALPKP